MSRRKDRERVLSLRRLSPDYRGFRGYDNEPTRPGDVPLEAVRCTVCGRKRNIPVGLAQERRGSYVCQSCQGGGGAGSGEPEGAPSPGV